MWQRLSDLLLRLRAMFWHAVYCACRERCAIDSTFRFNGSGIQLDGDGCIESGAENYVRELCTMQAAPGRSIRVGRHCTISHNVRIYTTTAQPDFDLRTGSSPAAEASVTIGDGVWIGVNAFIAPGVSVDNNPAVGANCVVTCDIPPGEIWAGVPSRRTRAKVEPA
jgi:maltose O-acetyltransferase